MALPSENNPIIYEDLLSSLSQIRSAILKLEGGTIVITGAAGFVCSYFADLVALANDTLLKKPCTIIAVDNFIGGFNNLEHLNGRKNFVLLKHDITKPLEIERADYIIHGASIASPAFYRKFPIETMDANVTGTRNMLELALETKCRSFLFMSTSEVYGDPPLYEIPTKETYRGNVSCTGPRACYDESKRFGETLCTVFSQQHGLPINITRLFNIYGPRLSLNDKRVIPDFISNALKNEPIKIFGNGKSTRTFCYISDAVTAHFKVLLSGLSGEIFNVGNPRSGEISMSDLAEIIVRLSGSAKGIIYEKNPDENYLVDNPERRCPDSSKIEKMLGWRAAVDLETGLKKTIEWHKQRIRY